MEHATTPSDAALSPFAPPLPGAAGPLPSLPQAPAPAPASHELLQQAQAEAALLRRQYVSLYEAAPIGCISLQADARVVQLNRSGARYLGLPAGEVLGQSFTQFVLPAYQAQFGHFLAEVLTGTGEPRIELELLRPPQKPFFVQLHGVLQTNEAGEPHCQLIVVDTDERRRAADALATSEARFRATFEQSNDGMVLLRNQYFVDANQAAARLLGLPDATALRQQPMAYFWPELQPDGRRSLDVAAECMQHAATAGWGRLELMRYNAAGQAVWDEMSFSPVVVQGQTLLHCIWRDITLARTAAAQLRQEQEFTSRLLEHSVDGIMAVDRNGTITAWNARLAHYTGQTAAEVMGRLAREVLPHVDVPAMREVFQRVLSGEMVVLFGQRFRLREGHYDAYLVPLREAEEVVGVLGIVRDVSERDRLTEEATRLRLRQQQEVLTAVMSAQEAERKRIAEALHNGLGQLLYAAKLSLEGQPGPASLAAQKLLREAIQATRTISFELTPGVLEDFGLRVALEELRKRIEPRQLLVHLHLLGLEQPLPPDIEIAVYRITQELLNNVIKHAQASEVHIYVVREGQHLDLTVEDNGVGFDTAAVASRPLGGIGLAGVRNRVMVLGGTVELSSKPGRGTVVAIELEVPAPRT